MTDSFVQRLGWVLWPSFLVACAAELAFFSLFDPRDLHLFGAPVEADRMLVYTLGFFALWALGAILGRSNLATLQNMAGRVFQQSLLAMLETTSPRAWAFATCSSSCACITTMSAGRR